VAVLDPLAVYGRDYNYRYITGVSISFKVVSISFKFVQSFSCQIQEGQLANTIPYSNLTLIAAYQNFACWSKQFWFSMCIKYSIPEGRLKPISHACTYHCIHIFPALPTVSWTYTYAGHARFNWKEQDDE